MAENTYKQIEEFEKDYNKLFDKGAWEPCDITKMKDLQKLMYYLEVREAMKNGGDYPGSEYMDKSSYNRGYSYARGNQMHNPMNGRFMGRGGSGTYPMGNGPWYYDDMRGSGRRYYDDEKEDAIRKLHKTMDAETNPEFKMAIQEAIHMLEAK